MMWALVISFADILPAFDDAFAIPPHLRRVCIVEGSGLCTFLTERRAWAPGHVAQMM